MFILLELLESLNLILKKFLHVLYFLSPIDIHKIQSTLCLRGGGGDGE